MGTVFSTLVGAPPAYWTNNFHRWVKRLLDYRLAECPVARTTTYYIRYNAAGSGAGGGGAGTLVSPYLCATPAHISTLIASLAAGGDKAFLLADGDTWLSSTGGTGITLGTANLTLGRYRPTGSTATTPPTVAGYKAAYPGSGWTQVAGQNIWWRADTDAIKWCIKGLDPERGAMRKVGPAALTDANFPLDAGSAGSFWHDTGGTLGTANRFYVRLAGNANPNSSTDIYAVVATGDGVLVNGVDGCRVDGIRSWGWGMQGATSQTYPIRLDITGTKAAVVSNCEGHWSSSHAIAMYNGAGTGGIATFINCRAGLCMRDGSGQFTPFNAYQANGAHEALFVNCEVTQGGLYDATFTSPLGIGIYGHTGGASGSLFISVNARGPKASSNFKIAALTGCGNLPAPASRDDWSALRGFFIGDDCDSLQDTSGALALAGAARINCRGVFNAVYNYASGAMAVGTLGHGWTMVNCDYTLDGPIGGAAGVLMGLFNATSGASGTIWNSRFVIRSYHKDDAPRVGCDSNSGTTLAVNSLFGIEQPSLATNYPPNIGANGVPTTGLGGCSGCVFFGFDSASGGWGVGYASTQNPTTAGSLAEIMPASAGSISAVKTALGAHPRGWTLEYDRLGTPRLATTTAGPIELAKFERQPTNTSFSL